MITNEFPTESRLRPVSPITDIPQEYEKGAESFAKPQLQASAMLTGEQHGRLWTVTVRAVKYVASVLCLLQTFQRISQGVEERVGQIKIGFSLFDCMCSKVLSMINSFQRNLVF